MAIIMPQELEVWYLLPAIRRELAKSLLKLELKQSEISRILGTSRAAITQYLKLKRASELEFNNVTLKEITNSAKIISKKPELLVEQIQRICKIAKQTKILCNIHKCNHLREECCEVCLK